MNKKTKLILVLIILIFVIAVIINEVKMRPKLNLINDVKKIYSNIENLEYKEETIEILINNKYIINNKEYIVKGHGVIFVEDNPSVMLSRNGMCAMKLPHNSNILFQDEECPNYRLINGEKIVVKKAN